MRNFTRSEKSYILPHLQKMVQSIIDTWNAQREIEKELEQDFSDMTEAAECLAVRYDSGASVTLDDVQTYIDACKED